MGLEPKLEFQSLNLAAKGLAAGYGRTGPSGVRAWRAGKTLAR